MRFSAISGFSGKWRNRMTGRTVSAYADESTASSVAEMARLEDRSPAQIAAAALRLYVRLPPAARDAWRRIEASGESAADQAAWAAGRALLDRQYEEALAAGLNGHDPRLPPDASETDILKYAVEIAREG
jgi:hypothetical protein